MNTRKLSSTQEKRLAKNIGGRQVIGSGSTPFLKGDVITSDLFIEAKTKAVESKSISVKKAWLEKAQEQAYSMRKKDYALAISFGDGKDYYVIEDNELNELTGSVRGAENYEKWKEKEAAKIKAAQEAKQSEEIIKAKVTADTAKTGMEKTEVKLTDYPEAFYSKKTEAKNTQALLDYVNAQNVTDPNILKLYKNMDKLCEKLPDDVVIKVTHGEHRVKRSLTKNFEWCVDVGIPKIDPKFVGTCDASLHEEMHFLDMLLSVRGEVKYPNKMFSESYKPLIGAFDKATPKIGDRAKKLFTEFSEYYQKINKKRHEKYDTMIAELDKQYYAGKIDAKKFNSTAKKIWKEIVAESDKEIRSFKGGGISGLQDIYDAISNGVFRDTGEVLYGHGSSYYQDKHRSNPNCSESLANYAALSIGHPELIEILAEDHPEIVKALRQCVEDMAKEVAKL